MTEAVFLAFLERFGSSSEVAKKQRQFFEIFSDHRIDFWPSYYESSNLEVEGLGLRFQPKPLLVDWHWVSLQGMQTVHIQGPRGTLEVGTEKIKGEIDPEWAQKWLPELRACLLTWKHTRQALAYIVEAASTRPNTWGFVRVEEIAAAWHRSKDKLDLQQIWTKLVVEGLPEGVAVDPRAKNLRKAQVQGAIPFAGGWTLHLKQGTVPVLEKGKKQVKGLQAFKGEAISDQYLARLFGMEVEEFQRAIENENLEEHLVLSALGS